MAAHVRDSAAPGLTRTHIVHEAPVMVMNPQPTDPDWLYEGHE